MAQYHVQKYLWHEKGQPFQQAWHLTLTDNESITFIAFITFLLGYTQRRAWKILCLIVNRVTRPIQLPDRGNPRGLQNLSQTKALSTFLVQSRYFLFGRKLSNATLPIALMPSISPWFGAISVINLIAFLALGTLVPWLLTQGLETPIVQSKYHNKCNSIGDIDKSLRQDAYRASNIYHRCWYNVSSPSDSCTRQDGILLERPNMRVSRHSTCPFAKGICLKDVKSLQLEYLNLTVRTFGINTEPKISYSRRLTCSPLELKHFIFQDSENIPWLVFSEDSKRRAKDGFTGYYFRQQLRSPDDQAPNRVSFDQLMRSGYEPSLRVWSSIGDEDPFLGPVLPILQKLDADISIFAYNAGGTSYPEPIDDPIYSAHYPGNFTFPGYDPILHYYPDFEFTVLGCFEQHRFCTTRKNATCSKYSGSSQVIDGFEHQLKVLGDKHALDELELIAWIAENVMNIHSFASYIGGFSALLVQVIGFWKVDRLEQWVHDVEYWFEASVLLLRTRAFSLFTGEAGRPNIVKGKAAMQLLCQHILFRSGDHTNFNFFGLITVFSGISLIVIVSYLEQSGLLLSWINERFVRRVQRGYLHYLLCLKRYAAR
ncbi:hypothetical protein FQN57_003042 [Myotisia sp. PD_48]|nr:hypothetical protein FQN57_003042 [Myotisia sp. PD_48]